MQVHEVVDDRESDVGLPYTGCDMKFVSMQHCVAASKLSVPQYSTATKTKLIIKFLQLNLHCCTMYKAKG